MSRRGEAVGDLTEVAQDFRLLSIPLRPGPFLQEFVRNNNNRRMSVFRSRSARLGAGANIKCRRPHGLPRPEKPPPTIGASKAPGLSPGWAAIECVSSRSVGAPSDSVGG